MLFVPDNVLEAFELPEAKDTHVLHLALLGSVGERIRDGPLADVWEMGPISMLDGRARHRAIQIVP